MAKFPPGTRVDLPTGVVQGSNTSVWIGNGSVFQASNLVLVPCGTLFDWKKSQARVDTGTTSSCGISAGEMPDGHPAEDARLASE